MNRFGKAFDLVYGRVANAYARLLGASLDRPAIVLGSGFALVAIAAVAMQLGVVPTEIFPPSDTRFVQLGLQTPNGTALAITNDVSRVVEDALRRDPRVVAVGATVGEVGAGGTARSITNRATLQITLKRGTDGAAAAAFISDWRRRLSGNAKQSDPLLVPVQAASLRSAMIGTIARGQTIDIVQRQISQGQTALELEIYGPDLAMLQNVSDGVMAAISGIPGVGDPDKNVTNSQPEVRVAIDRRRASELGLGTGDVAQFISSATNGSISTYYQINGIQYPILVELAAE
jgi:HAE1 family hydrophobic/amphiphilic exporter-1